MLGCFVQVKLKIIKILSFLFNRSGLWKFHIFLSLAGNFNNKISKPLFINVFGKKLFTHPKDDPLSTSLYYYGDYEPFETDLFQNLIKKGDTVLDIGAHIGYYTLLSSGLVGRSGKVFSFEPDPDNLALLRKNVEVNNLTNVVIENVAVSDRNKRINFYRSLQNRGDNRIFRENSREKCIKVDCITLDNYFNSKFSVDFVKMDIQGAEVKALLGMPRTLKDNKDIILTFEFWPYGYHCAGNSAKELLDILDANRFLLFDIGRTEALNKIKMVSAEVLLKNYQAIDLRKMTNILCIRNNLRLGNLL